MDSITEKLLIAAIPSLLVLIAAWLLNRKLESFKHDLLSKVHARKFLFEKEMEFYERLFRALTELRNPIAECTSPIVRKPVDETWVQYEQKNYAEVAKAYNELYNAVLSFRPFYPEVIYSEAESLLRTCYRRQRIHDDMISELTRSEKDASKARQQVRETSETVFDIDDPVDKQRQIED
jgi:hypothetical protein